MRGRAKQTIAGLVLALGLVIGGSATAHTQTPPDPTVTFTVDPPMIRAGRPVTLRAVVHDLPPVVRDGAFVRFVDEWAKVSFGDVALVNGQASLQVTPPPDGFRAFVFFNDTALFSDTVFANVISGFAVNVSFSTVPTQPHPGDDVVVNATVTVRSSPGLAAEGGAPLPSGLVTVFSGNNALGSSPIDNSGHASIPVTLPAGFAPLTVGYDGDDVYIESTSTGLVPTAPSGSPNPPAQPPGTPAATGSAGGAAAAVLGARLSADTPASTTSTTAVDRDVAVSDDETAAETGGTAAGETAQAETGGDGAGGSSGAERSSFVGGIPTPGSVDWSVGHVATNLLLALLLMLLASIPAVLVDGTIQNNYDRIVGVHPRLAAFMGRTESWLTDLPDGVLLVGLALVAGLVFGQLDPSFGFDPSSAVLVAALALVVLVVVGVHDVARLPYLNRRSNGQAGGFGVYPFGVVLAIALVVLSRVAGFEPGFVFGVVGGLALSELVSDRDDARSLAAAGAGLLGIGLAAWLAWIPVVDEATGVDPSTWILFVDAFLSTLWLTCVQAVAFGFAPFTFLDGDQVRKWSLPTWVALYGAGMFLLAQFYLHPSAGRWGALDTTNVWSAFSVFAAFLVVGVAFWAWFRFRPEAPNRIDERDLTATG